MDEKVLITKSSMEAIGDAIRYKRDEETEYLPSEMPAAIRGIPNVYALGDEGKVVKNGALVAQTARAQSITENGTYDTTENNEVTVAVPSGGVPTPTYPDEKCIDRWDFTSGTPLIGTLNGKTITQLSTTFDSNGAHFADNSHLDISNLTAGEERLIRVVLGECTSINPSRNHRFVMTSQTNGFLWIENGNWGFYNGQFESDNNHTNLLMFSNSELIIHIDTDGTWKVYKDSELVYSPTQKIVAPSSMYIGSSDQSINGFTIEKLEIYRDIDPSDAGIEVIPLSVGSNGVYTAPSGKAYSPVTVNVSGGSGSLEPVKVHIRGQSFIGSNSSITWNNTSWPSYQQLWIDLLPYQGKQITIRNSGNRNMYGFTSVEPYDGLSLNSTRIDSGGSLVFTYTGGADRYLVYDFSTSFDGGLVEIEIQ